jgi:hypothetical protein
MRDVTILKETRLTRRVDFRLDKIGVYFLFYQSSYMTGGVSYQWPLWFMGCMQRFPKLRTSKMWLLHHRPGLYVHNTDYQEMRTYYAFYEG